MTKGGRGDPGGRYFPGKTAVWLTCRKTGSDGVMRRGAPGGPPAAGPDVSDAAEKGFAGEGSLSRSWACSEQG